MKLIAYGPFTDTHLDLSAGQEGFHVIYGANEAGKSSALRALRHLFYGIPGQSPDNFLHSYAKMRIGATVQSNDGEKLEFIRRKGRSNTLRQADDRTVIEDAILNHFLNGVDADLFETMFGIGYPELVRGGWEIVQGGGNLGQLIFSAGSGVANLREIQNELQSEADALFRPSGQKPKINAALSLMSKNRKEMRAAELPGQEWENHYQALQQAKGRINVVEKDLRQHQRKMHRLERIQEALPLIARRRELQKEHRDYEDAVRLPDDFTAQRRDLTTRLEISKSDRDRSLKAIEAAETAIDGLKISDRVLVHSKQIEEVYQELGSQRKAARDRIKLETRKAGLRSEAREILRNLREDLTVDEAEQLRIKKADTVRIQELGAAYERIVTRIESSRELVPRLTRQIAVLEKQLKNLGDPRQIGDLKSAVDQAREQIAAEKHSRTEWANIRTARKTLEVKLDKLPLWSGSLEELERLATPSLETVNTFEAKQSEAEQTCRQIKDELDRTRRSLAEISRQIEEMRLQQEVPTEDDLRKARDIRDHGWQLVLNRLDGKTLGEEEVRLFINELSPADTLSEAFQASLLQTDEIADRLRREADRVAGQAKLIADQTAADNQLADLAARLEAARKAEADLNSKWLELWQPAGITPNSPKEMQGWLRTHSALAEKATELRERTASADTLTMDISANIKSLSQILKTLSEPPAAGEITLGSLVKKARPIIEKEQNHYRKQEQLSREIDQRTRELADVELKVKSSEEDLARWQQAWEKAVRPLGLEADAIPAQANAVMSELKELFDRLKDASILQKRIEGIDRDANQYRKSVTRIAEKAARDLIHHTAEEATSELNSRLTRARKAESKRQALQDQLNKERHRFDNSVRAIDETETGLHGMCKEAGCSNYGELPDAEKRSVRRLQIEADLKGVDERLLKLSGGATIDSFIKFALEVDPDGITDDIARLAEGIEKLNSDKSELDQTIGREENELSKMDGNARAAELAEDIQIQLGGLEYDIEQYARLKIASRVLNQAIERYRDKSQGPILNRASGLFHQITGGSFDGVRADFDDNGSPMLVGVRSAGGEIVPVDGMSDGTADQLYLALRLAGLEDYLAKNEPIPFIVDDILIKFDDARATATLKALSELSSKTQILFFTHHRHLVELAKLACDPEALINHDLET
jgi:uncharacterized protein YhaN